jgi:programmed cell death 6-interacting protein
VIRSKRELPKFAAGTFKYLRTVVLQALELDVATAYDLSAPINAGYDMTGAFIETMETLCLAQAQECFWQRALMEKYTHSVVAKLAMKVRYVLY